MWTFFKNCLYNLNVRWHIMYRLMWIAAPIHFLLNVNSKDTIEDEAGCTMNVTHWNGRAMAMFAYRMYAKIKDLTIRQDDVILCGYPKTGCHWTFEILYMILNQKAEVSKYGKVLQGMIEAMPEIILNSVPSRRVLNTHVLYNELPRGVKENKNKIILTIRCPKDTVVSFYNHTQALKVYYQYKGMFENYFKMFMKGEVDYGSYFDHYLSWSEAMKSQEDNQIYFLSYEDLKENTVEKVMEIAEFLETPVTKEFAEEVAKVTSFSKLKEKRPGNGLYRKGIVGDWRNWLTDEQSNEVDRVWRETMAHFKRPPEAITRYCD